MKQRKFSFLDPDKWSEVLQALLRNKTRSMLTAFGVFWGIFMLVFLMGGGKGFQRLLEANFDGIASNAYFAFARPTTKPYQGLPEGRQWELEHADLERVKRAIPEVELAVPLLAEWAVALQYKERSTMAITMKGVSPEYADIEMPDIVVGRNINASDVGEHRRVCVLGRQLVSQLFTSAAEAVGKHVKIGGHYYEVVGVNGRQGHMGIMGPAPRTVMVPFSTMQRLGNFGNKIDFLAITIKRGHTVAEIQDKIRNVLREAHRISPNDEKAVADFNLEMLFSMINNLFDGIEMLIWMIGLGTLLSGAIGVSNIMMVTVSERTMEIGIRRAIGARPSHILAQVLSESMLLTIVAGLCGIAFATLLLIGVEYLAENMTKLEANFQISFFMAIAAAVALALMGAAAGIMPALRALKIRPIDAIRDE